MKLTFLGTAAAEGFPGVFCRCEKCLESRRLKGKNIRTRSQSIINDDLLIDLPADTFHHFLENDIEGDKIKFLLVTHSHSDHFYPNELHYKHPPFAHNMRENNLKVICGGDVYRYFEEKGASKQTEVIKIEPFETVEAGDYQITALPARHAEGSGALIYIIRQGDKTLFYAHDTGYLYDEVFAYIAENNIRFDMISFDCTNVNIPASDEGGHMGIANIQRVRERLGDAIKPDTKLYINHFSHNGAPIHHELEAQVNPMGLEVSYDGCVVEF